ncbi:hypothetical protein R1sor_013633 [Riccia sorocarpa]|uniref:SAP domain-containing protein n=1 Tax=Riccia sorocarpa TaxID=122646 RepID=A0ABD3HAZ8_9MARC
MTGPPRPKYPSDSKNYHDLRQDDGADAYMGVMEDPRAESVKDQSDDELAEDELIVWDFITEEYTALDLWEEQKKRLHHELVQAGRPLVVYVDFRFDSSRSGFHGTLPVINKDDDQNGHLDVDNILAQHSIMSSKDLWHKCKNLQKAVESATTIDAVAVFSVQMLKDFCKENGLHATGNKLQLVQRVSVSSKLPETGANTEIQHTRHVHYPELAQHDLAYN